MTCPLERLVCVCKQQYVFITCKHRRDVVFLSLFSAVTHHNIGATNSGDHQEVGRPNFAKTGSGRGAISGGIFYPRKTLI